jgi:hypothetical protein
MKTKLKSALVIAVAILGAGFSALTVTSCKEKPKTLGEKIDDALDARPHEKLKDTVEDAKDAVKDEVKK